MKKIKLNLPASVMEKLADHPYLLKRDSRPDSKPTKALKTMKCIECPKTIHQKRLDAIPQAKTCSAECSATRKRRLRSEAATRCHRRQRAKNKKR